MLILLFILIGTIGYLLSSSSRNPPFKYVPMSDNEYKEELKWFVFQPITDEPFSEREKRIVCEIAERTGKKVNFSYIRVDKIK